jgi:flagellar hook-associated protein 1 FlgK
MTNFGGLDVAYTGLAAHRRRMDVISENIVNSSTPGYHRQRVDLSAVNRAGGGLFSGMGGGFGGVEAAEVTRVRSRILSDHARQQASAASVRTKRAEILERVEDAMGGIDSGGLHDQMMALWNSFDDLAASPDDTAIRQIVLDRADSLAKGFTQTTSSVDLLRQREIDDMVATVDQVNALADEIAILDAQILGAVNSTTQPNSLFDERDRKVTELAQLIDLDVVEHTNGQVSATVDGHLLVGNGQSTAVDFQIIPDPTLGVLGYDKVAIVTPTGRELRLEEGALGASLETVMQTIPDERRKLDDLIDDLTVTVNAIHSAGAGLDSSTGRDLFEIGSNPGELRLSGDVAGQPAAVAAAAAGGGALDDTTARALAQLAETPDGPSSKLADAIGSLASRVATARAGADAAEAASEQATALAQAAGGVSLDQELTDLIAAQRAFEAAARLVSTIDEMLNTLINGMAN